jgi:mono/diheme cytochrome c family protein
MKKLTITALCLIGFVSANTIDAKDVFQKKCVVCHTDKKVDPSNKANLIAPPIDEVALHIKENFKNENKAVAFMVDYIFDPDPKKALCASMDKFGLMPSQKGALSQEEALEVNKYIYQNFPREDFAKKERQNRANAKFDIIDTNKDGFISPQEFKEFRAKKNGIDVSSFKQNLFFKKIDLNNDGKMDKEEFNKMREHKAKQKGN